MTMRVWRRSPASAKFAPNEMRNQETNVKALSITEHPFFVGLDPELLALLVENAKEVEFQPNDIIFREGDPANCLYLIQSGKVVLESRTGPNKRVPIQELNRGDALGWSWLFPPFTWHCRRAPSRPHA